MDPLTPNLNDIDTFQFSIFGKMLQYEFITIYD